MPYEITQCYLQPDRGGIPALTPAEAGTRFTDVEGKQGWVDLSTAVSAQPVPKAAYRSGRRDKHNRLPWDSTLGRLTPQSDAVTATSDGWLLLRLMDRLDMPESERICK